METRLMDQHNRKPILREVNPETQDLAIKAPHAAPLVERPPKKVKKTKTKKKG